MKIMDLVFIRNVFPTLFEVGLMEALCSFILVISLHWSG